MDTQITTIASIIPQYAHKLALTKANTPIRKFSNIFNVNENSKKKNFKNSKIKCKCKNLI